MTTHRTARPACTFALLAAALALASPAHGQQRNPSGLPAPRLWQVNPPGGKAGTTVEVVLAGRNLDDPTKLVFSHPGLKAEFVAAPEPKPDPKDKKPRPGMAAPSTDFAKFKVTIAANVSLGHHDVRLVNKWGVSNPRT